MDGRSGELYRARRRCLANVVSGRALFFLQRCLFCYFYFYFYFYFCLSFGKCGLWKVPLLFAKVPLPRISGFYFYFFLNVYFFFVLMGKCGLWKAPLHLLQRCPCVSVPVSVSLSSV